MQADVAKSQAATLRGWADIWRQESESGTSEIGFLLDRAARQIDRCMGIGTEPDPEGPQTQEAVGVEMLRAG